MSRAFQRYEGCACVNCRKKREAERAATPALGTETMAEIVEGRLK